MAIILGIIIVAIILGVIGTVIIAPIILISDYVQISKMRKLEEQYDNLPVSYKNEETREKYWKMCRDIRKKIYRGNRKVIEEANEIVAFFQQ